MRQLKGPPDPPLQERRGAADKATALLAGAARPAETDIPAGASAYATASQKAFGRMHKGAVPATEEAESILL